MGWKANYRELGKPGPRHRHRHRHRNRGLGRSEGDLVREAETYHDVMSSTRGLLLSLDQDHDKVGTLNKPLTACMVLSNRACTNSWETPG